LLDREDRDADDLIDTLTRLAAIETNGTSAGSVSTGSFSTGTVASLADISPDAFPFPKSNAATPGTSPRRQSLSIDGDEKGSSHVHVSANRQDDEDEEEEDEDDEEVSE
jgi:hypothetical protein